jgi:aminoglycoside phosphotransferase (APT) family kinase protein
MANSAICYPVAHRSQEHINSFKTRYEDFDATVIPEVFEKSLGLRVTTWKPSDSWGSAHVIYFVSVEDHQKPLVLRANTGFAEPETAMLTEKLITDLVISHGLPTNKVLHVDISRASLPFDYQIQELIEGSDPEVNFPDSQTEYDQLSFELGQYIARLSEIKLSGFGLFDKHATQTNMLKGERDSMHEYLMTKVPDDLDYLLGAAVISPQQATNILQALEDSKDLADAVTQPTLVHHDLADHNLKYLSGHLSAVFDWETAISGDVALDLVSCPTWGTLYPREEKLLEGFTSIRTLPEYWIEKRDIYRLRTMLWKIVYAIRANILNAERVKKFEDACAPFGIYS